ncbi:oligosaccharide flippase family protein [Flagellimonas sp.]|uniref:oligosaccharide flippase family protein n=1 Tax=Flagellimonas sp. TaxID=2058762 RepID=UPI003BA87B9B
MSRVLANSGIYTIISLLQKGVNFLLVPLLTAYLSPKDYGIVAVITAINAFLNVIYLLSLNGCLNRFYYEYEDDKEKVKVLFGTVVTFVFLFSIAISIILFVGHKYFLDPFLDEVEFYPYMVLGLISVLFNPVFTIYQNTLQARQQGKRFGKNNMMFFLTNLVLLLIFIVALGMKAEGVLASIAITNVVFFIMTISRFGKEIKFGIDFLVLRKALVYSLPLVPHSISGVSTAMIDRVFINNMLSTATTGIYNLGSTFGGVVFLVASGVQQAFVPWFNQKVKQDKKQEIAIFASGIIQVYCMLALGLSLFSENIIAWVTPPSYHKAWYIVPIIAFAFVFHSLYYFFSTPFFYDIDGKGSRSLPIYTILSALINVFLNFVLIRTYGFLGAALATLIAKVFLALILMFSYKKFVDIAYNLKQLLLVPLIFLMLSAIAYIPNIDLFLKAALFFIVILTQGFFNRKNLEFLRVRILTKLKKTKGFD